jgi:curved DNA-binding protein CbpA
MKLEQSYFAETDFYAVMRLTPDATVPEVIQAFERLSEGLSLTAPDPAARVRAAEKMLALTQAYEVLSDPVQRSHYDLRHLGRKNQPVSTQVDGLFREAMKAFKQNETEMALNYFKQITQLYPHRPLYRVHLAIAYAEKHWLSFAEAELETALRLDPGYKFARETVAHLLFRLPDKQKHRSANPLNRQALLLASGFVGLSLLLVSGLPQQWIGAFNQQINTQLTDPMKKAARQAGEKIKADNEIKQQLPQDMVDDLAKKQQQQQAKSEIPQQAPDFMPAGQVHDYRKQQAQSKTFYPEQGMVVVTYADGSILTYRPAELQGWKEDAETHQAVMITRDNELIPAPANLPLKLPDGSQADVSSANFPAHLFPEYKPQTTAPAGYQAQKSESVAPARADAAPASQGANPYSPYSAGGRP